MSLLQPTPGEMLDRITIVELKIAAFNRRGTTAPDFLIKEKVDLEVAFDDAGKKKGFSVSKTLEVRENLTKINTRLWHAEDEVRAVKGDARLLELARLIPELNDIRMEVVHAVDILFGITTTDVKIYNKEN